MREREIAAWHEAGHAAALKAMGELNGRVMIDGHGNGGTQRRHSLFFGTTLRRKDDLKWTIAGPLVDAQVTRTSVERVLQSQTFGGDGDGDWVNRLLGNDSLDHWVGKTKRLISGYDRGIKDLAEALLDTGSVDGRTAAAILNGRR